MQRPGGRSAANTAAIRGAVMKLLVEGGVEDVTFQRVAEEADIARSTLYRRFEDRWAMLVDALVDNAAGLVVPRDTGSLRGDLSDLLGRLAEGLKTPMGAVVMSVLAGASGSKEGRLSPQYGIGRMQQVAPMFDRAVERGELPADADRGLIFSMASGAVWFHHFVAARDVDEAFIAEVADTICDRFADCD